MAKELTKEDIKDVVTEALEPFASAIREDFKNVNLRFDKVDSRLDKVDSRLDKVDSRLDKVDSRLDNVDSRLDKIESDLVDIKKVVVFDIPEMKQDIKETKENSRALFANFDKYIKLYEDQKQEMLIFGEQLRRLENRVIKLETELNKK